MRHQKAANHEGNRGNQRRNLQIRQAHNRVSRRAATRVACAKTDQKTTQNDENKASNRSQTRKTEQISWHQTRKFVNALGFELRFCFDGNFYWFGT